MKSVVVKHKTKCVTRRATAPRGFSLVELLIVVAILGILAAIVTPQVSGHSQKAKEAAVKANLFIFREAIGRYAVKHNDIAPGYLNNDRTKPPAWAFAYQQLIANRQYLRSIPENPFNGETRVQVVADATPLPEPTGIVFGWFYKPATKTFKLNWPGNDSQGVPYFDY